jgi:hypothetical protein
MIDPENFHEPYSRRPKHVAKGDVVEGGKIRVQTMLTPRMWERIRGEASTRKVSASQVIRELIYAGLKEEGWE